MYLIQKESNPMAEKKQTKLLVPPQGGMMRDLVMRLKLIVRLMADGRVSPFLKLLPVASLVYLFFPFDLVSIIPGVSALDDVAIVSLGGYLFVEFCPPDVVQEHMKQLSSNLEAGTNDEVVDGESTDVTEKS
jgi:uncharacterized membrane protein YkvA (DUF1232 family)